MTRTCDACGLEEGTMVDPPSRQDAIDALESAIARRPHLENAELHWMLQRVKRGELGQPMPVTLEPVDTGGGEPDWICASCVSLMEINDALETN
jgi:hypothetical protein